VSTRQFVALALLALLGGIIVFAPEGEDGGDAPGSSGPTTGTLSPAADAPSGAPPSCLPCHQSVVDEWRASMHAAAFTDPQVRAPDQADNFRKTECLPCHAPRPVFEYGIEDATRVVARVPRRHDGVDCLACHGLADGSVAASRPGLDGACRPVLRDALSTQALCAPCHNQHNTHDEWRASPAFAAGETCQSCHMPRVLREGPEAGAPRSGRSHRFLGGRDREFALSGLTLEHEIADGALFVTLTNTFAGHNLPTDSRNRALDLVVTLYDLRGQELDEATVFGPDRPERHPGGERGTARRRFRNPYRSSGDPSTQLPAGESATLEVPLPDDASRARIELLYKMEPWIGDEQAQWSERRELTLD